MKVALIGECMIELKGTAFGTMFQSFGGDTLNTAIYLKRLAHKSVDVHYVTAVGTDALSSQMVQCWKDEGVNTDLVLKYNTHNAGLYMIHLDDNGERSFSYWRNNSAAKLLCKHSKFESVCEALEDMDIVYLSGISLAILSKTDRDILISVLKTLSSKGVNVMFDTNYRPALWSSASEARIAYRSVLSVCTHALVTYDDEQALWRDKSHAETLERLQEMGVKCAVIKTGAEGCLVSDLTKATLEVTLVPAAPVEKVVDTTSAGDSFNAGFISAYLMGEENDKCCELGNKTAAVVIQHNGAIIPKNATLHLKWN